MIHQCEQYPARIGRRCAETALHGGNLSERPIRILENDGAMREAQSGANPWGFGAQHRHHGRAMRAESLN